MKTRLLFKFLLVLISPSLLHGQNDLASWVNPMVGTGGHGHTFPGATTPFGMVQLSPDTRIDGSWDGCSGYHYGDSAIYGFSHTHLSGTGCSDLGDIAILPITTLDKSKPLTEFNYRDYRQKFSHENEKAEAGYYAVKLNNGVQAELTATPRVGIHRYTFPSGSGYLVIQLDHRDLTLESSLKQVSPTKLVGMRRSKAWAQDQHIYFSIEFSQPFQLSVGAFEKRLDGGDITYFQVIQFKKLKKKTLLVKTAISQVDIPGAEKNMTAELPHWDFNKVKTDARNLWNTALSKINAYSQPDNLKKFYTSYYHCLIHPSIASDVDGRYRGRDLKIHQAEGFTYYNIFSLWDTYRALHPLLVITEPDRTRDFIRTFLVQHEQGGRLPVWELSGNETNCMIGYHSVSVIADAWSKGIRGFDEKKALDAMIATANADVFGLKNYRQDGFLGCTSEAESVSKTVEYAYDDWCILQFGKAVMGEKEFTSRYPEFCLRASYWQNLFDQESGFLRPRRNGGWLAPFDPYEVNSHYTEANAWQYQFGAQHQLLRMAEFFGEKIKMEEKLNKLFAAGTATTGRTQADISGLLGQYAHGNEPSHHIAWIYSFLGRPENTAYITHKIGYEFYQNKPDGLIGNEDCGQMSAWYVFAAMGFYPLCPGDGGYVFTDPILDSANVNLGNGKILNLVKAVPTGNPAGPRTATLNGKIFESQWLPHAALAEGGRLTIRLTVNEDRMKPRPEQKKTPEVPCANPSAFLTAPVISSNGHTFTEKMEVTLGPVDKNAPIFYTTNGQDPSLASPQYEKPVVLTETTTLKAVRAGAQTGSKITSAHFIKIPAGRKISLATKYSNQYTAGGPEGLIDFIQGGENFRLGAWQGYLGVDVDATVDLGRVERVSKITAGFLHEAGSWILMPSQVIIEVSLDGKIWKTVYDKAPGITHQESKTIKEVYGDEFIKTDARYVRVRAVNAGVMPPGHPGAGDPSWIFIDEISIE